MDEVIVTIPHHHPETRNLSSVVAFYIHKEHILCTFFLCTVGASGVTSINGDKHQFRKTNLKWWKEYWRLSKQLHVSCMHTAESLEIVAGNSNLFFTDALRSCPLFDRFWSLQKHFMECFWLILIISETFYEVLAFFLRLELKNLIWKKNCFQKV